MRMNKRAELPLTEPLYSTYHYQGICTAIIANNPTVRNWYLNESMDLACNRKFLKGYSSPDVTVPWSSWFGCPCFEVIDIPSRFAGGYINPIIRKTLDEGYYVVFSNVDDYYVRGKSWYKKRHFFHDGVICGYDQNDKTYCVYAYDSRWIYRKFWTSQSSFNAGRVAAEKQGSFAGFYALRARDDATVEFSPQTVYTKLREYLDSDLEKYPFEGDNDVNGIVVHKFIAEYMSKLYRGEIPYERTDRRVFRLIWEHKKAMRERIEMVEKSLGMNDALSRKYATLVARADTMRMLYASHIMKRRDSVLPVIKKMLLDLMKDEQEILTQLLEKMGRKLENGALEIS